MTRGWVITFAFGALSNERLLPRHGRAVSVCRVVD